MPEPQRPLKVFLSYASQDKPSVRELSRRLVREGWIETWQDEKSLLPGQDWRAKIEEAVEEADVVIICLSNQSVSKEGHVQKELRYAREIALEKPEDAIFLIPLRLDECEVPRGLRFYQWVDYFEDKKDSSYKALVASLKLRYEQKLRVEKEERLRKEKQEREAAEQAARDKAEKQAEERRRIAREKADRDFEERKIKEKEPIEKLARKVKGKAEPKIEKPVTNWKIAYGFSGLAGLILLIVLVVLLNNSMRANEPALDDNSSQIIVTRTIAKTMAVAATSTPNPKETLFFTFTFTPTPLPEKIIDAKNVPMALVPFGKFIMGSEEGSDDANHVHEVYLDDFYMDIYEVTNTYYEDCVNIGVCSEPTYWEYYREKIFADHPVVYVTWAQADEYCKWRGGYLPTEAQWEKAARGIDGRTYPWGENIDCNRASFRSCNKTETDEVGSYEDGKSPYGIYDMAGNVWEWTADWYEDNYYQYSSLINPTGPISGVYRVMRGGAWSYRADDLRTYNRCSGNVDGARNVIGFRCAKSVTSDSPATPVQTETPTASETPANGFEIIALPTVAYRGGNATITIRTQPRSACELGFVLPSGQPSAAGGLGPRTADDEGICSWTWTIASNTGTGAGYATIIAGGASERYMIEIK